MLSLLIPAYNQGTYVKQAIESALNQNCILPLEVVVCDDASTDETVSVIEEMLPKHSNLRLIKSGINRGVSATRNTLMNRMHRDTNLVVFLDSDDLLVDGRLNRDIERLHANTSARFTYGHYRVVPTDELESGEALSEDLPPIRGPQLTAGMYRVDLLREVGNLDESFTHAEDVDYLLRIVEITNDFIAHNDITFYYRRHKANVTRDRKLANTSFMRALFLHSARRRKNPELLGVNGLFKIADRETMMKIVAL